MQFGEFLLESRKYSGTCLENGEHFAGGFDLSLPSIDRLDTRQKIDARRELRFHQQCANLSRLLQTGEGAKDH